MMEPTRINPLLPPQGFAYSCRVAFNLTMTIGEGTDIMSSTVPSAVDLSTIKENVKHQLYGLLIGINSYNAGRLQDVLITESRGSRGSTSYNPSKFQNLRGAVPDARNFYKYLTSELNVPQDHITLLCDESASREAIIDSFQHLAKDPRIQKGDSIVIFYAGHGAQALPPQRLLGQPGCPKYIELLVPYDFNRGKKEYMGIPDYTLAALLNAISQKKGDTITVIFDCCHSASALRGCTSDLSSNDFKEIARAGPELDFHLPNDLDESIWGTLDKAAALLPRLRQLGATSYVFFSACASFEMAKEKNGRGYFTTALLDLLQDMGVHALSCSQIISRLNKIEGQTPQCEGLQVDRNIFHEFSAQRKKFFNVRRRRGRVPNTQPLKFILEAGSVDGFSIGDEFTVYKTQCDEDQTTPLGRLVIDRLLPGADQYVLRICPDDPPSVLSDDPFPALLTKAAEPYLQLYVVDDSNRPGIISCIQELNLHNIISFTSDRQMAHIALSILVDVHAGSTQLCFDVVDAFLAQRCIDCGRIIEVGSTSEVCGQNHQLGAGENLAKLCGHHLIDFPVESGYLARILGDLAHYYHHLKRISPYSASASVPVDISFFKLNDYPPYTPIDYKENLYDSISCVIELEVDSEPDEDEEGPVGSAYGLQITNNSQWDLYPALFYFDNSEFTIVNNYTPPLAREKAESPLKAKESITIGFGVGAGAVVPPFLFFISDPNQKREAGIFKLILSTVPMDLTHMLQKTPVFNSTRGMTQSDPNSRRTRPVTWVSFDILVILRARE